MGNGSTRPCTDQEWMTWRRSSSRIRSEVASARSRSATLRPRLPSMPAWPPAWGPAGIPSSDEPSDRKADFVRFVSASAGGAEAPALLQRQQGGVKGEARLRRLEVDVQDAGDAVQPGVEGGPAHPQEAGVLGLVAGLAQVGLQHRQQGRPVPTVVAQQRSQLPLAEGL